MWGRVYAFFLRFITTVLVTGHDVYGNGGGVIALVSGLPRVQKTLHEAVVYTSSRRVLFDLDGDGEAGRGLCVVGIRTAQLHTATA